MDCNQVAPFVAKTYQMVNDPRTDSWIHWGKANNSFLVPHPNHFSQFLLPSYFKHCNFSSFVRQLNTYGFKKVDPDRWEFAHKSFLRGQIHLLHLIVRRRIRGQGSSACDNSCNIDKDSNSEELLLQELFKLGQEQEALDEELQIMSKRLQATESQPQQLMSFLLKIAENPQLLHKFLITKKKRLLASQRKRPRILSSITDTETEIGRGNCQLFSASNMTEKSVGEEAVFGESIHDVVEINRYENPSSLVSDSAVIANYSINSSTQIVGIQSDFGFLNVTSSDTASTVKFPFSLFL